jgi:replicative DNA helicase
MTQVITPPNSKENEMMVLGCALTSCNALDCIVSLTNNDFYFTEHKTIFSVLKDFQKQNKPADIHLVAEELKSLGKLSETGGVSYLTVLAQYAGTSAYIDEYISLLKEDSTKRKLLELSQSAQKAALNESGDVLRQIDFLQKELDGLKKNQSRAETLYGHLVPPTSETAIRKEILQTSPGVRVGMMLGKVDLKLQGGAMTILAGPTGHGKTLVKINMVLNYLNLHPDKKAYFFSYEESRAAILSLFLNAYIGEDISSNNRESIKSYFRDGKPTYVSQEKQGFFVRKKEEFFKTLIDTGRLNIFYCDYAIEELADAIRFLKDKSSIGLVAIDYMQMLRMLQRKSTQRQEELKEVCLMLKNLAIETGLPMLIGAQFNRTVVNEATMSPVAIGEAGDIERAAHTIIGLWNRNCEGLTEEGNKGKDGKKRSKESAIYLEILKGRDTGIGHSAVFDLNGNAGKISNRTSSTNASPFG